MTREQVERNQLWLYAAGLGTGAVIGVWSAALGESLEALISPVLAIMLYGMFAQIPLLQLREAFVNRRFTGALLAVNFVVVPALVWLLSRLLPQQPPLLLGVYLVLLTPCIDYVIVFTHLGRGDARLVLASTPLLLLAQMLLLPAYLRLFMGQQAAQVMSAAPFLEAFAVLIALPLALALATQVWAKRQRGAAAWLGVTAWLPVPFMALVLLLVVASQIGRIEEHFPVVIRAVPIYVAFMLIVPLLVRAVVRPFGLDVEAGRALIFSAGTRNSLVVLPLALALPEVWAVVPAVIVTQTLVELTGELLYIRLVPRLLPDTYMTSGRREEP